MMKFSAMKIAQQLVAALAAIWSLAAISGLRADGRAQIAATPIVVQAIAFSSQGGGQVAVHPNGRGSSPAYIHEWCTPGHWLEWSIDTADPGDYQLVLHYGEKFQTARDIRINGEPVKGLESVTLPSTGDWPDPRDFKASAPIPLHAGKNILRIACLDTASIWLYQIKLIHGDKSITVDPAGFTGQGGGIVQAVVSDDHGFFNSWDYRGHALEWTIPDAAAGDYTLSLCCATRDAPVRELRVNGQLVKGFESFIVPWTGGWRNWCVEKLPGKIPLRAGRNVLRLTAIEDALNISYIRLSAPGTPDILINGVDFTGQEGGEVQIHPSSPSFIDKFDHKGQWLQWTFQAPAAGRYNVTLRYMGPAYSPKMESPADLDVKPCKFELNGSVVPGLEAYMAPGAGDALRDWRQATLPVPMTLQAGSNVFKITAVADGPLALYEMRFTPVQDAAKAPQGQPP